MNKYKIILDTDIGDDIDDAFALAILLQEKQADLIGVTTVFRNARQRGKMASYLISTFKRNVNVYCGCDNPLIAEIKDLVPKNILEKETVDEYGKYYLPQYLEKMNEGRIEKKHAIDFIIESVHQYPHQVIIFGIGPLTNLAMAIRKDPSIVPLIKEVRLMGGDPTNVNTKEWNIFCDPEAARIVFSSKVNLYIVGLNVTLKCQLTSKYRELLKNVKKEKYALISEMMEKWFKHYEFNMPVMHDPLAIACLFDDFCKFEKAKIKVGLENEKRAVTYFSDDGNDIYYAKEVDVEKFFDYFVRTIFEIKNIER